MQQEPDIVQTACSMGKKKLGWPANPMRLAETMTVALRWIMATDTDAGARRMKKAVRVLPKITLEAHPQAVNRLHLAGPIRTLVRPSAKHGY